MKYSAAVISSFAALALAKPEFLNSSFDVEEGVAFTLTYSGCDDGCTILLQNGPLEDRKDFVNLTGDADGDSTSVTVQGVPTDTYNFKIIDNNTGEFNYSKTFKVQGTGVASTSAEPTTTKTTAKPTTSTTESTSEEPTSTTAKSTTVESTTSEASSTETSATTVTSVTSAATTTTESDPTTTADAPPSTTTIPDDGAGQLNSPLGMAAGAVAAILYLI